ncbi:MAG TPA: DUF222 domain-containing protein, partial [Actinomycetota bacterium]|nr:DUF222 domain-containing protein [Actinomycetota bacterium]
MDQALVAKAEELRERLICDQAMVTAGQARMVNAIAECAECGAWEADGAGDLVSWVMATLNVAYPAAADLVGLARRLRDLPELAKSFAEGRVPIESAGAAAKLATPETDAFFAETAEVAPAKDLLRAVKNKEALAAQNDSAPHRASLDWKFDAEGWARFSGWLAPEEGAKLIAAIERAGNADDHPDPETGGVPSGPPAETKAAKGLLALAATTLEDDADPDRATVVVHVELAALISGEGAATLAVGGVVPAVLAQRLACDGRIEVVVEDHGRVRGVAVADRRVPAWMLRQLHHRDNCCQFPGCGRTRHLHAHHRQHFAHGGPTDL